MKALEIARVSMLRSFRDRMGLFFIVALPVILVIVLGMTYGGMNAARVGVSDEDGTALSAGLIADLRTVDTPIAIRRFDTAADLRDAVQRGFVEIGLAIPSGYDAAARGDGPVAVEIVAQPQSFATAVRAAVAAAVSRQSALVSAARFSAATNKVPFDTALAAALDRSMTIPGVAVSLEPIGEATANPNGFAVGAQSQVILFMFLTSLTGAAVLISTRQLGISRREFSTPTGVGTIVVGEALGRFAFALFQGGFIVVASVILFGVDWIDPLAVGAVIVAFALVAAGAAMLLATLASNEHQLSALAPALGMIFGLLGGTMVPIDVFPSVMKTLSQVTPHAWAMDALRSVTLRGGDLVSIAPNLAVLAAFAVVLLSLATFRFRRAVIG